MIEQIEPFEYLIISHEAYFVQKAWEKWGGSFIKGLSQALLHADPINMKKIHDNWKKEWYEALDQWKKYTTGKPTRKELEEMEEMK